MLLSVFVNTPQVVCIGPLGNLFNRPLGPDFCFTRGVPSSWLVYVVVTTIFINVDVLPRTVFVTVDVATPQVIYTGSLGSRFEAVRAGF